MNKSMFPAIGAAMGLIAIAVGAVFYNQRGEHLAPSGTVLKVRMAEMQDKRTLAVLDVRLRNDSDVSMVVKAIELTVETTDGNSVEGMTLGGTDLGNSLKDYPLLGELFTPALTTKGTIPPRSTVDRTIAAAFDVRMADMESRKKIDVKIEGPNNTLEFSGK